MRFSTSSLASRLTWYALAVLPGWACATAVDNPVGTDALDTVGATGGDVATGGASGSSTGGTLVSTGGTGANIGGSSIGGSSKGGGPSNAFGGGAGMAVSGGSGGSGQGGTASIGGMNGAAGQSSGGTTSMAGAAAGGSAGKGGSTSGGAGGVTGSAGKGGTTGSAGKGGSGGSMSAGGSTSTGTCDAAHSAATVATGTVYNGKTSDCVRLAVNTGWSAVKIEFQAQPGTAGYPIPYSFSSCAGSGTGSLSGDYVASVMIMGANPGCDVYVQFKGSGTTLKVTYYD